MRHFERHGCELRREGSNHSVSVNRTARKTSTVPRHREINDFSCPQDLSRSRGSRSVAPNTRLQRTRCAPLRSKTLYPGLTPNDLDKDWSAGNLKAAAGYLIVSAAPLLIAFLVCVL